MVVHRCGAAPLFGLELSFETGELHRLLCGYDAGEGVSTHAFEENCLEHLSGLPELAGNHRRGSGISVHDLNF